MSRDHFNHLHFNIPTTKGDPSMTTNIHRVPCDHAGKAHTLWIGIDDGGPPVPMSREFDNQADGLDYIQKLFPPDRRQRVWLLKLFPTESGEAYACWQWAQRLEPEEPEPLMLVESRVDWAKACFAAIVVLFLFELARVVLG